MTVVVGGRALCPVGVVVIRRLLAQRRAVIAISAYLDSTLGSVAAGIEDEASDFRGLKGESCRRVRISNGRYEPSLLGRLEDASAVGWRVHNFLGNV